MVKGSKFAPISKDDAHRIILESTDAAMHKGGVDGCDDCHHLGAMCVECWWDTYYSYRRKLVKVIIKLSAHHADSAKLLTAVKNEMGTK